MAGSPRLTTAIRLNTMTPPSARPLPRCAADMSGWPDALGADRLSGPENAPKQGCQPSGKHDRSLDGLGVQHACAEGLLDDRRCLAQRARDQIAVGVLDQSEVVADALGREVG